MPEVYGTGNHDRKAPKTSVPVASPQAHKVEQGGEMQVREQPQPGTSGPVAGPEAHKAEQGGRVPPDRNPSREQATEVKARGRKASRSRMPVAGPHAREELQDEMKTPGTGALPELGTTDGCWPRLIGALRHK